MSFGKGRSRYTPGKAIVDSLLILSVVLLVWVAARELWPRKDREQSNRVIDKTASIPATNLGQDNWRVGTVKLGKAGTAYDVSILTRDYREIFKIKMDAATAQPLGKATENKARLTTPTATISGEQIVNATVALLPKLTAGQAVRKKDKEFLEVPIIYQGQEIAKLRVDATTHAPLATGEQAGKGEPGGKAAKPPEKPKLEIIPKKWVLPLGYLSGLIAVISAVYYSWKRSLFAPMRAVASDSKAKVAAGLRRTLKWHEVFGLVALAAAGFHVVNLWPKLKLSVSWLTTGMMVVVILSGVFGEFLARNDIIRAHWRRFHVPYTILFFIVLLIHFLQKIEVFGD